MMPLGWLLQAPLAEQPAPLAWRAAVSIFLLSFCPRFAVDAGVPAADSSVSKWARMDCVMYLGV